MRYLAMKFRYDHGVEGISEIMYCITSKGGGGLAILPLVIEIEENDDRRENRRNVPAMENNQADIKKETERP